MIKHFRTLFLLVIFLPLNFFSQGCWKDFNDLLEKENLKVREIRNELKRLDAKSIIFFEDDTYKFDLNEVYKKYKSQIFHYYEKFESNQEVYFQLKVISFKRKVIHLELSNMKDSLVKNKGVNNKYSDLIKLHNKKMNIKADTSFKYFNPQYEIVVNTGFECEGGSHMDEISILVKDSNRLELIKWCHSLSPEIRFYGMYGFIWLLERGIEFSDEEKKLIDLIYNENTTILYCDSCEGNGLISIKEYTEILFEDFLEFIF